MKIVPVLLLSLFLSACSRAQVASPAEFEKGIAGGRVQLVDVRTPTEYDEGHIAGAIRANIHDDTEFNSVVEKLNKDQPVYVYCRSGRRSHTAADELKEKGFKKVVDLDGGINAWKEDGKPVVTGSK